MVPSIIQPVLVAVFPLAMIYAAATDLLTMTLSNKIVLGLIAGFLVLAPVSGMTWETFALHGAAGGVVLLAGFTLFAFGWIGGGDAKLAAAIGLWLGWGHLAMFVGLSAVFGGLLTLAILSFRRRVLPQAVIRQPWVQRLHREDAGVPYGVALAAGALAVYPATIWTTLVG